MERVAVDGWWELSIDASDTEAVRLYSLGSVHRIPHGEVRAARASSALGGGWAFVWRVVPWELPNKTLLCVELLGARVDETPTREEDGVVLPNHNFGIDERVIEAAVRLEVKDQTYSAVIALPVSS